MKSQNLFPGEKKKEQYITKTSLLEYILKILPQKNENFQIKNSDIFHNSAQNIDYGYSLEPTIYVFEQKQEK